MSEPLEIGELRALNHLADAWNAFASLRPTHPSDADEFQSAIHRAQDVIAARIVRRDHPEVFPTRDGKV